MDQLIRYCHLVQRPIPKQNGFLTLVPLPKTDEIYMRLKGFSICSTFCLRSDYYYMALLEEVRAKSAFVTPIGKFQFTRCLLGLAHAPSYFQQFIYEVLTGLEFAIRCLVDYLVLRLAVETHLQHL